MVECVGWGWEWGISFSDKRFTDEKNGSAIAHSHSFTLVKGCKRMEICWSGWGWRQAESVDTVSAAWSNMFALSVDVFVLGINRLQQ